MNTHPPLTAEQEARRQKWREVAARRRSMFKTIRVELTPDEAARLKERADRGLKKAAEAALRKQINQETI